MRSGPCSVRTVLPVLPLRWLPASAGLSPPGGPYAPGASGKVCTEEIAHALQCMGYDTGIDLAALLQLSHRLPALVGHDVPSQLLKAGRRLDLYPRPTPNRSSRTPECAEPLQALIPKHAVRGLVH